MARLKWWFANSLERSKWFFTDLRDAVADSSDAKLIGALVLVAVLAGGGYFVARKVSLGVLTRVARRI